MQLTLDEAKKLIPKYLHDKNNQIHSRESEVVLRGLAKYFNEDESLWGLTGLLHDLDWEQTASNPIKHGLTTETILKSENLEAPAELLHAIAAHNEEYTGIKRESKLDYALAASESITGLIYAYALMRPEKLAGMSASSLNKKFKDKYFAAKVSRALITDIEKIGLEKSQFFQIAINAMQEISSEINLN